MRRCHWGGCTNRLGQAHDYCPRHRSTQDRPSIAATHEYDPRYERARTVTGAQARYVADETDYDIDDLEPDLDRLLG
jgi:hypothetical protein